MGETLMIERKECPLLRRRRTGGPEELFPSGIYCRLPSGRVRIPSHEELAQFCTAGLYYDCPRFARVRAHEMDLTGLI